MAFKSGDGTALAADWRAPRRGEPVFVLLHGLGAGRGEWRLFAARAAAEGWGSLALDMRGHGDSGGPRYTEFRGPSDWLKVVGDARAAVAWLKGVKHVAPERVVMGGASIGANLALRAAEAEPRVRFALLLSPGWDYQGVTLPDAVAGYGRPILMAASPDDPYAYKSSQTALRLCKSADSGFLEGPGGHGVRMLEGPGGKAFGDALFKRLEALVASGGAPR